MFSKTFVTIAFSTKAIQVVKLNASKTKIETHVTIELPQGVIKGHRVVDMKSLSEIIVGIWGKFKIKEKAVGIIVPEFSTFVKLLEIPLLDETELHEAITWQIQEFFPKNAKEMIMDWKIVEKTAENYKILTVSMDREILSTFVGVVGASGLYPIVVETPSLSLTRVLPNNSPETLLIYQYFDETILVVTKDSDAVVSSVIASHQSGEIVSTARRLLEHYKDVEIKTILLGGIGIADNLPQELSSKLGIGAKPMSLKVSGLSPVDLHKYLIPASLQYKEPKDPRDVHSINLLPSTVVKKYLNKRFQVRVYSLLMLATFLVWTSFIAALGTYLYFKQQINSYTEAAATSLSVIQETEEARGEIRKINQLSSLVLKINEATIPSQEILNAIEDARPQSVNIARHRLELDRGEVDITGVAATRNDLIQFKQQLEESGKFADVTIPISFLEVENNLNFSISMRIIDR